jgi:cytochrome P450
MRIARVKSGLLQVTLQVMVVSFCICGLAVSQDAAKSSSDSSAKQTAQPATKAPMTEAEKRKADLQADTEKLYKLTQELKAEVDKSNKDTLSVSVVKKAQEIERLAKSIKERSKSQ